MICRSKTILSLMAAGVLAAGLPSLAQAQSDGIYEIRSKSISATAGVHFTIPLGHKRKGRAQDKARLGFNVGLVREYESRYLAAPTRIKFNMLDMGYHFDGTPSLLLNGQDIYTPLFDPIYADEEGDETQETEQKDISAGQGVLLVVAGAVGVVGILAVVATAEAVDDFTNIGN